MKLFNVESALLINALKLVHEAQNLAPQPVEKVVHDTTDMGICGECAELTPKKELTQTGEGHSLCPKCEKLLGNFDSHIYDEEVAPERLFDGDGQPAGWI